MSLFRNARTGGYEADFREKGMKRLHVSLRTDKKRVAQERYAALTRVVRERRVEILEQLRAGTMTVERVTALVAEGAPLAPLTSADAEWGTVDQAAERYVQWLEAHPNKSDRTAVLAAEQLKRFREWEYQGVRVGGMLVAAVTTTLVDAYQAWLVAEDYASGTVATYVSRVGTLWRWLEAREVRAAREHRRAARPLYNPVDAETTVRNESRRTRMLLAGEVTRLIAATPEPLAFPVLCGLLAGLRLGEVLHLRPELDVDLAEGTLSVAEQPDWKPKTKRSIRIVPMAPQLIDAAKLHAARWASAHWMIPAVRTPSAPMEKPTMEKQFRRVVETAGLVYGIKDPQGVTFHTLRHSFASHAVMRGVDLYTVAQLLGDSLKMTESVYAKLSKDHKRAAIAKLAGAFKLGEVPA